MKRTLLALAFMTVANAASADVFCFAHNENDGNTEQVSWSKGQVFPPAVGNIVDYYDYLTCTVTGPEVNYVRTRFVGFPVTTGTKLTYRGDTAQFLIDGLTDLTNQ